MAQSKFKIGDVVILKSGSPEMTIKAITTKRLTPDGMIDLAINRIKTQWFVEAELKTEEFSEVQLEHIKEN